jgi:histidine triad (HIT) family protein
MEDDLADSSCIFCRIVAGEIPAKLVHEDDETIAFRDINPQAPTHVLVIPRRHIASVNELTESDGALIGRMHLTEGVSESGYRLVMNTGAAAGQTVHHIHLHILGGRSMAWPPG